MSFESKIVDAKKRTPKERTVKMNAQMIRKINDAGGTALVVRSVADVKAALQRAGLTL